MQSGASSRAGGTLAAPFPPRARLGFRVPPAAAAARVSADSGGGGGAGAGQDPELMRMQSVTSASKATTGGTNVSPGGSRKVRGLSDGA